LNTNREYNTWNANTLSDTFPITSFIDYAHERFVSRGIPVIIGEFGAMNKNNVEVRAQWTRFYVQHAMSRGMPCFWWDNGIVTSGNANAELFGLINRTSNQWIFPEIVSAIMGVAWP
jgi:endoglucanase